MIAGLAAGAVLGTSALAFGGGVLVGGTQAADIAGQSTTSATDPSTGTTDQIPPGTQDDGEVSPWGSGGQGPGSQAPGSGSGSSQGTTTASEDQQAGLAYIRTEVSYDQGEAAGTGMVLSSDGEILTNHHVVEGATAIEVEIAATGQTYSAEVVGYDAVTDVALLQLDDASGLDTVTPDTTDPVEVGDEVTGVGNAGGSEQPSAASGTVTGLEESIDVADQTGGGSEQLTGLIEVDADIVSGDSGGPLYDADDEVVGMNTAASSGSADITGYAIPIGTALEIVSQIQSGEESGTVQIGATPFLGVTLATQSSVRPGRGGWSQSDPYGSGSEQPEGVAVQGVVDGSAAEEAGITGGDAITAIDGTAVGTASALSEAIAQHEVGDRMTVTWTDTDGQSHSAEVTLGEGPVG
ncbi:UNVERIFIED_CONTAM: hypothetical protein LK11_05995 [Mumia flava]